MQAILGFLLIVKYHGITGNKTLIQPHPYQNPLLNGLELGRIQAGILGSRSATQVRQFPNLGDRKLVGTIFLPLASQTTP